jgi:hypothetical protein
VNVAVNVAPLLIPRGSIFDGYERTVVFALVAGVGEAIRDDLGDDGDIHPGPTDPAGAGQVNRAYRAAARRILRPVAPRGEDAAALLAWALGRIARSWLGAIGLDAGRAEAVLAREPPGREDWPAFLILAPRARIEQLLVDERIDPS